MLDFMDMDYDQHEPIPPTGPYIPDAGECLRCGMCVSTCPTFRLFQTDEETPRRRIRTISKLLVESQAISSDERFHLDNCLQCRACETVCPSRMAYGQLFDQARAASQIKLTALAKLALGLVESRRLRTWLLPLLSVYLQSGLQKPLRKSGFLQKLGLAQADALLSRPALRPLATRYAAAGSARGRVALFTGCIADHFDRETLLATIRVLNAIGFEVLVPLKQGCCGAIHQHNGQSAAELIANNIRIFNELEVDAVIHTATGCGAMLSEYPGDDASGEAFSRRLTDIHDFLLSHWPDDLKLSPFTASVAVHEPCSQRHVLKNAQQVYALLAKIPGLNAVPLADNHLCCGAGGSYMLTHPDNAERLRAMKREVIAHSDAEVVVSGNYACAMFIRGQNCKIEHPMMLLARQLPKGLE